MRTIRPLSAQDCINLLNEYKTEIQNGEIGFQIEKDWLSYFNESILMFFAQYGTIENKLVLLNFHQLHLTTLRLLAKDQSPQVRHAIAGNHNTPPEILIMLANDTNKYIDINGSNIPIREAAIGNPNMPQDMLRKFATDADFLTRVRIARNPNTPSDVLELLARAGEYFVRESVISNPNTPISIIELLKKDSNDKVRREAEKVLNKRNSCFIATEVYGSPLDVNVLTLKEFRDGTLMTSCWGKLFVTSYYQISPSIAYLLSKNKLLRMSIKYGVLNPIVWIIKLIKHPTE